MLGGITALADDLADLKAASVRYVAAMKAALALSDGSDCYRISHLPHRARSFLPEAFSLIWLGPFIKIAVKVIHRCSKSKR